MGAFPPPLPAGEKDCYISDHTDIAMGVNSASKNKEDAKKFLEWLATPEFAALYANALPGFFPLSKDAVKIDDDLAATMVGWRKDCKSTIRNSYQIPAARRTSRTNSGMCRRKSSTGRRLRTRRRSRCRTGWISGINRRPSKAVGSTGLILRSVAEGGASRRMFQNAPQSLRPGCVLRGRYAAPQDLDDHLPADMLSVVMVGFAWNLILSPLWGVAEGALKAVGLGSLFALAMSDAS